MSIRAKRGTTAQINAAAAQNGLKLSELIYDTDKGSLEVATGAGSRQALMKEAFATKAQAEAGTDNTLPMTPLRTAQAIATWAGDVVLEAFTSSGTFAKQADDIFYLVEMVGGGEGGGCGQGGTSSNINIGGGGGAGEVYSAFLDADEIAQNMPVVIGAAGVGGRIPPGVLKPSPGGDTSFGSIVAKGGGSYFALGDASGNTPARGSGGVSKFDKNNRSAPGAPGRGTSDRAPGVNASRPGDGGGGGGGEWGGTGPATNGGNGFRGEVRVYRFKRTKQ